MPVTPGTLPVAGHAAIHAIEVDPSGSQGVFTTVPEVTSSIDWDTTREKTVITPHGAGVSSNIVSQVITVNDISGEMTFKHANTVHAAMLNHYLNKVQFGWMMVGPDGTAPSTDTVICSGEFTTFKKMAPARNGEYKVGFVFTPSGPFKANGVIYS